MTTAQSKIFDLKNDTERLIVVVLLLLVFLIAARSPVDTDLWWHLRAGEETLSSGSPVLVDSFSYTRSGQSWTNHSWLSQVILAGIFRLGGLPLVGLFVPLLAVIIMLLLFMQMDGPVILRAFVIVLASTVSAVVWTPRPQMFSLLLFALVAWMLNRYKRAGPVRLWPLPLIFFLWSNLHGGYPLGFLLIGAFLIGEGINHLGKVSGPVLPWKDMLLLAGYACLGLVLVAVNPNGVKMWAIPFQTVDVGVLQQLIQEWASPDFHDLSQQPFLWMLFALILCWALAGRRVDGSELLTVLLFAWMGFTARRNVGPFSLVAAPALARALTGLLEQGAPKLAGWVREKFPAAAVREQPELAPGLRKGINLAVAALLAFAAFGKLAVVNYPAFTAQVVGRAYPVKAVEWIEANRPEGRLFNEYNWGGYLTWALPAYPVFVDGRTDLFGDEVLSQWIGVIQAEDDWQESLDRWAVRLVLIQPGRPLVSALEQAGWKLVVKEEGYLLYER